MNDKAFSTIALVLRVSLPFAGGYFLSYLYRSVNAVLAPRIVVDMALNAEVLGFMTGIYLLAFGLMQVPLGILLDRYGPRRVEAVLLLIAATGAALFAEAERVEMLILGRALIGAGVSACLMAAIKANVQFYPTHRLALANSVIMFAGGLGAVAATEPVRLGLALTTWQGLFWALAGMTGVMALILFLAVPDRAMVSAPLSVRRQLSDVAMLCRHPDFLRVAPAAGLCVGSFVALQGLWAGPWLRDVAGLGAEEVARALFLMAIGMACGHLFWGGMADVMLRRRIPVIIVVCSGMVSFLLAAGNMAMGWHNVPALWSFIFGFSGSASSLSYVLVTQLAPPSAAGRANTTLNLIIFAVAFSVQWGIGAIVNLWPRTVPNGGWSAEAYRLALVFLVLSDMVALLWMLPLAWRHWRRRNSNY